MVEPFTLQEGQVVLQSSNHYQDQLGSQKQVLPKSF